MVSAEWSDLPAVISQSSDHGEFIDKHDLDYIDKCTLHYTDSMQYTEHTGVNINLTKTSD